MGNRYNAIGNQRHLQAEYIAEVLAETEEERHARKEKYCAKCKYGVRTSGHTGQSAAWYVSCNYASMTGHVRGCSPIDCAKYEPGEPLKRKRGQRRK